MALKSDSVADVFPRVLQNVSEQKFYHKRVDGCFWKGTEFRAVTENPYLYSCDDGKIFTTSVEICKSVEKNNAQLINSNWVFKHYSPETDILLRSMLLMYYRVGIKCRQINICQTNVPCFLSPWKQKTSGFLIFSGGTKRNLV